ncbi:hypothetical protein BIW11_12577 [Tropilaelaps mercedesae]|uniref:Uncharacterized protein n=1 Tax=Tropilaelaps mercedesae TaxID=418985 RepID=A0A1V9X5S5_9ACAR|nr:hypothetical protein BIW11_12577 [Tropilaelaps mercedesae]
MIAELGVVLRRVVSTDPNKPPKSKSSSSL